LGHNLEDDAQHAFERKALRNVRGLLDKLEQGERGEVREGVKWAFVTVVAVFGVMVVAAMVLTIVAAVTEPTYEAPRALASQPSYGANPRKAYVSASMAPLALEKYADACTDLIRERANTIFREEFAGVRGSADIVVAIRSDGLIEAVTVRSSMGHAAIEPTAKRVVLKAGWCAAFPDDVRGEADILYIHRTIVIGEKVSLQ
jgi:hypothetical protein